MQLFVLYLAFSSPILFRCKYPIKTVVPHKNIVMNNCCDWEPIISLKQPILHKYFNATVELDQSCEVFCFEGVPVGAIVFRSTNEKGGPIVEDIYLNKGMLLLFDCGQHMRKKLFKRYMHIDLKHATQRNEFLLF